MSALSRSIAELRTNPRQWEAFNTEGHCVVLAPPGSGKTKLLTTRLVADLLNKIPRPHGAACITLTTAAADELQQRVQLLGLEDRPNIFIGTVHGFALRQIIEPFARLVGRPALANVRIASEQEQRSAMKTAIREAYPEAENTKYIDSTIRFLRQRLSPEDEWAKYGSKYWGIAERYLAIIHDEGLHDFLEIVAIAVDFVENNRAVRKVLASKFPHLYVDEYQDLAPGLHRLIEALCFDIYTGAELFAVGDPDQAVYAWTGTRPELLDELAGRSGITCVPLELNYRCGEAIIQAANKLRQGKPPIKGNSTGGNVTVEKCPGGLDEQYMAVVNCVRTVTESGVPLHDVAVLSPFNAQCDAVAGVLRSNGIPAAVRESAYRLTTGTSLVESCAGWATYGRELSNYRLADILRRWRSVLGQVWTMKASVDLTDLLMELYEAPDVPAVHLLDGLMSVGLNKAIARGSMADEIIEFNKMRSALVTGSLAGMTVAELGKRARKVDRVEITTMTSSKGLEFDVVLILGADEESIPSYQAKSDPAQMREDRRKFYVSITRARREVNIFYSGFVIKPWVIVNMLVQVGF